jgi:hypothetical protein
MKLSKKQSKYLANGITNLIMIIANERESELTMDMDKILVELNKFCGKYQKSNPETRKLAEKLVKEAQNKKRFH